MAEPDAKAAPKPPPNLRVATDEGEECEVCTHYERGKCAKYSNLPVDEEWVCDSFAKGGRADTDDDGPEPKNLKQAAQKAHRLRRNARKQADEESSEKKPDDESSEQQK